MRAMRMLDKTILGSRPDPEGRMQLVSSQGEMLLDRQGMLRVQGESSPLTSVEIRLEITENRDGSGDAEEYLRLRSPRMLIQMRRHVGSYWSGSGYVPDDVSPELQKLAHNIAATFAVPLSHEPPGIFAEGRLVYVARADRQGWESPSLSAT